jgi:urea transport system permease protein
MVMQINGSTLDESLDQFRKRTILGVLCFLFIAVPVLNVLGVVDNTHVNKLGRYLCFAIVALGIDLLWGYTGLLGLCQALFFCMGGYVMAMHLSLPQGGGNVRPEYHNIPQFFFFNNVDTLPGWWAPFASLPFTLIAALAIPALFSLALGFMVFRSRVRGVYFAIITQAVAWGAFLLFCRNEMLLGGTNGLTNFSPVLNRNQGWVLFLYLLTVAVLTGLFLLARWITKSRLGRLLVAVRDKEMLLNFLAYRPESIKLFAFVAAALFAAVGGMLYVPQNGIITPNVMRVEDSIWMIIWVALGGRGYLWGAAVGALLVNYGYSVLTSDMPRAWPFFEGGMFLAVVMLFPSGLVGLWEQFEREILAGARLRWVVAGLLLGFLGLIVYRSGWLWWLPGYGLWVFGAIVIALTLSARSLVIASIASIAFFFISEALGLVPESLQAVWFGAPVKYYALFGVLGGAALVARLRLVPGYVRRIQWA